MSADITKIEINPNLRDELHKFPAVATLTEEAANKIAEAARAAAPVNTGAYRDGITVQKPAGKSGVARVVATDQKSAWIEFGNANQEPQFVMRSAVEASGLQFKKGRS